ncbi:MAG: TIGR00701 family protein [Lysobacterales bacterium]|jgi:putative membrane protein|nr:MAG: TIGR00701 family protein [Xanthomonadales bacterium]
MAILWLKAFHIIFVVTWFAGLFYLPRLFIYHLEAHDETSHQRFATMERRLLAITHIGGSLAVLFGLLLLLLLAQTPGYLAQGWLHAKLTLIALLIGFHLYCARLSVRFGRGERPHGARFLRWFNELPALVLIATVLLVVLKPF